MQRSVYWLVTLYFGSIHEPKYAVNVVLCFCGFKWKPFSRKIYSRHFYVKNSAPHYGYIVFIRVHITSWNSTVFFLQIQKKYNHPFLAKKSVTVWIRRSSQCDGSVERGCLPVPLFISRIFHRHKSRDRRQPSGEHSVAMVPRHPDSSGVHGARRG